MNWLGWTAILLAGCLVMPRTKSRQRRYPSALSPESAITMSVKQVLITVGIIAASVSGYAYLVYTESTQGADIVVIKTTLSTTTKEQDAKRDQMGKDFLDSQTKLNAKVSELTTAVQVQQHDTQTMSETLKTISNQLGNLTVRTVPSEGKQAR
jgi:galactitol-specific phosphotransferase system IIB component